MTNIKTLSLGRIKLIFLLFFFVGKLSIGFSQCDCADLSTSNLCNGGYFPDHATCASSTDPNQGGTANPYTPPTPLPWNTLGSSYTFCVKYTIPAGVTKIGFMNFVNTRKTPSGNCGGAFSRGNWSAYANGCSNPVVGTSVVGDPNSNEFDVTAGTEYRFCVTVTLNGTCSDITGIENYLYNATPTSTSCGTCATPTCPVTSITRTTVADGRTDISTELTSAGNQLNIVGLINGDSKTVCVPVNVPSGSTVLGFKQKLGIDVTNCDITINYDLKPTNCGASIPPDLPNASGTSSGFNPEWNNLTPGDYVLCYTLDVSNSNCDASTPDNSVDILGLGYYNVVPNSIPNPIVPCPSDQTFTALDWTQADPFPSFPTSTYTCISPSQTIWKNIEDATIATGGELQAFPGFFMEITTDALSDINTSALVKVNGTPYSYYGPGPAPAGTLDWGPMAIPPKFQNILEPYLTKGATISIELCDLRPGAQSFPYTIWDYSKGNILATGTATPSATNCTTITFTISAPTMSWKLDGSTTNITDNNNGSATFNPADLSTGSHTIVYTYDNGAGCPISATQTIDVNTTKVSPTTSPVSYCQNETTSPLSVTATSGNTLNWYGTNATGGTSSTTAPTPNSTNVGQTTYYVSQTNTSSSCESPRIPLVVTIKSSPTISISSTPSQICIDESANLTATGASTYSWDSDMATAFSTSNPITVTPTITTNYTVTGTLNGCSSTATYSLTVNSAPIIVFEDTLAICEPESINLADTKYRIGSTAGSQFKFYTNSGLTNILMGENAVSSSGKYYIQSTLNGCKSKKDSVVVVIEKKPVVDYKITPKTITTLNPEAKLINESAGAVSYNWNFGDGTTSNLLSPKHMFVCNDTASFLVKLSASTKFGCSDSIIKTVKIIEEIVYFVPNTFTPDGDQFNQEFKPIFASGYDTKGYTMYIFNRWGQLIFQTNDITKGWDGKNISTGEFVQNGSYTWKIIFSIKNDDRNKEIVGKVNVLK